MNARQRLVHMKSGCQEWEKWKDNIINWSGGMRTLRSSFLEIFSALSFRGGRDFVSNFWNSFTYFLIKPFLKISQSILTIVSLLVRNLFTLLLKFTKPKKSRGLSGLSSTSRCCTSTKRLQLLLVISKALKQENKNNKKNSDSTLFASIPSK